jgi:hypothetical protein
MSGLGGFTLTVRFLCELAMLAALAFWGFVVGDGLGAVVLGVAAVASSLLNALQEHQTSEGPSRR